MKTKTRSISVPGQIDAVVQRHVRSGKYANASDVYRAGVRALMREEMAASYATFMEIMNHLPPGPPSTPELEQEIVQAVRKSRERAKPKDRQAS